MYKTLLPLAIALGLLIPGCVDDNSNQLPDISQVYGPGNVVNVAANGSNVARINVAALEGRFVGQSINSTWATMSNLTIAPEMLTLQKTDPGPNGGGGVVTALEEVSNITLEVRFANASQLAGYDARFAKLTKAMKDGTENVSWSEPIPVTESWTRKSFPGRSYEIIGELMKENKTYARTVVSYLASFEPVTWTIHSAVRPVRAFNQAAPANYDAMGDEFTLMVPSGGVAPFRASTVFDGTYAPGEGTDIGVQLLDPDRAPVNDPSGAVCADAGGPGPQGAPNPNPADIEQAHETLAGLTIGPDLWTIRVGACYGNNYYHNAGMVPYVLTLLVGAAA